MCLEGCPAENQSYGTCLYDLDLSFDERQCFATYSSKPYINKYCLPSDKTKREPIEDYLSQKYIEILAGDIVRSWDLIFLSGIFVSIIGTLCLSIFKFEVFLLKLSIFVIICCVFVMFGGFSYLVFHEGERQEHRKCDDMKGLTIENCVFDTTED